MGGRVARDDSMIDTGLTSAASRKLAERQAKKTVDKQRTRALLRPEAEQILAVIDKEKAKIATDLSNLPFNFLTSKEDTNLYLAACQMHLKWCDDVKNQLRNVLRIPLEEKEASND